jgi:DnaJ-class molecular chaperone
MTMRDPKVKSFIEWRAYRHPNWEDEYENSNCEKCGGEGKVECPTCGEISIKCEACAGTGNMEVAKDKEYHKEYENEKANDLRRLKEWNQLNQLVKGGEK